MNPNEYNLFCIKEEHKSSAPTECFSFEYIISID